MERGLSSARFFSDYCESANPWNLRDDTTYDSVFTLVLD
jgi:hypothetical protein